MVQLISANKRNCMVCKLQPFLLECQVTSLLKKHFLFLGKSYKPKMTKKKERKKEKKKEQQRFHLVAETMSVIPQQG
jgi:hypothetical protein